MAEVSRFFSDIGGDRLTTAAQLNRIFDQLLQEKDGVIRGLANTLAVTNSGSLAVDVNTGSAIMAGRFYENTASVNLALDAVTSGSKRYDRIVVRVSEIARTMVLTVIKGTESASPSAPAIDGATDVLLAKILVDRSSGDYAYTVTDERVYNEGLVSAAIAEKINGGAYTPAGAIIPFGGVTAPSGYLECDGSAVSRTTYADLFTAIGTTWGSGDGSTTFNIPDLRETALVGIGTRGSGVTAHDTYTLGQYKDDQMQGHEHTIYASNGTGASGTTYLQTGEGSQNISVNTNDAVSNSLKEQGLNGTPRLGTTTHGKQAGVLYCIKY